MHDCFTTSEPATEKTYFCSHTHGCEVVSVLDQEVEPDGAEIPALIGCQGRPMRTLGGSPDNMTF